MKISTTKSLPVDVMMKYMEYHNNVDLELYKHISEEEIVTKLYDSKEDHQKRIFVLAHRDVPVAFHAIDDFQKRLAPGFLHDRCEMAKQEAGMWIENELLDEGPEMMLMSGAGGRGNMMRYYITLFITGDTKEIHKLQKELNGHTQKNKFEIESSESIHESLIITMLIHIDYSVDEVVMEIIHTLKEKGYQLMQGYEALNTEYPSEDFIKETKDHLGHMEELKENLLKHGKKLREKESFREAERMVDLVYDLKPEYADLAMRCGEQGIEFVCEDFMLRDKKEDKNKQPIWNDDLPF